MQVLESRDRPAGAVLVVHSWWGLTDSFREYGDALAAADFLVGLADLFDGHTARTGIQAQALRGRPRRIPMYKSLSADIETLRRAAGRKLQVGIVGFSMGGHWAVWLSQRPEYEIAGTVLYYAARAGSFDRCRANILAHFAEHDDWVRPSARKAMERAISKSGCGYQCHDYPGTTHWFAESDRSAEFDAPSAKQARERDIAFLRACLAG